MILAGNQGVRLRPLPCTPPARAHRFDVSPTVDRIGQLDLTWRVGAEQRA